jgi:hypothetical protein
MSYFPVSISSRARVRDRISAKVDEFIALQGASGKRDSRLALEIFAYLG